MSKFGDCLDTTLTWIGNNKLFTFTILLAFSLMVSTWALSDINRGLRHEINDLRNAATTTVSEGITSTPNPIEPSSSTEPSPTEPSPTEPSPTEPSPTEPSSSTEPSPTEPSPTEPSPTESSSIVSEETSKSHLASLAKQ